MTDIMIQTNGVACPKCGDDEEYYLDTLNFTNPETGKILCDIIGPKYGHCLKCGYDGCVT